MHLSVSRNATILRHHIDRTKTEREMAQDYGITYQRVSQIVSKMRRKILAELELEDNGAIREFYGLTSKDITRLRLEEHYLARRRNNKMGV